MKTRKTNLDERQERTLLEIESRGFWLAFWGLLAGMAVEMVIYGFDFGHIAVEWAVFMVMALYVAASCARNGIWDRRLKMNAATNLVMSLIGGAAMAALNFAVILARAPGNLSLAGIAALIAGLMTAGLIFLALSFAAALTRKRQQELEAEPEEEE